MYKINVTKSLAIVITESDPLSKYMSYMDNDISSNAGMSITLKGETDLLLASSSV